MRVGKDVSLRMGEDGRKRGEGRAHEQGGRAKSRHSDMRGRIASSRKSAERTADRGSHLQLKSLSLEAEKNLKS